MENENELAGELPPDFEKFKEYNEPACQLLSSEISRYIARKSHLSHQTIFDDTNELRDKYGINVQPKPGLERKIITDHLSDIRVNGRKNSIPMFMEWIWLEDLEFAKELIKKLDEVNASLAPNSPQPTLSPARKSSDKYHYSNSPIKVLGRDKEKATLRRFVKGDKGFKWLQLAGAGGQGKSRMANDLINYTKKINKNWAAGFLKLEHLTAFADDWDDWEPDKPYLIVVDYVIGSEVALGSCMRSLSRRTLQSGISGQHRPKELEQPIRLLLLERHRWDRGEFVHAPFGDRTGYLSSNLSRSIARAAWFERLNEAIDDDDLAHQALLFGSGVVELGNVGEDSLLAIVQSVAVEEGQTLLQNEGFIKSELLRIDPSGRPLYAYFLAKSLIARTYRPGWNRNDLLNDLLRREQKKRWRSVATENAEVPGVRSTPMQIAIIATIARCVDCNDLERVCGWPTISSKKVYKALVLTDSPLEDKDAPGTLIAGLEPDILGEWFVLSMCAKGAPAEKILVAAWQLAPTETAAFLLRVFQDFPENKQVSFLLDCQLPTAKSQTIFSELFSQVVRKAVEAGHNLPKSIYKKIDFILDRNHKESIFSLGIFYFCSKMDFINYEEAYKYFKIGELLNHGGCVFGIASCYFFGLGADKDKRLAIEIFKKSANLGMLPAFWIVGSCYYSGDGTERNLSEAYFWFRAGAEKGHTLSKLKQAEQLLNGDGVAKDQEQALTLFDQCVQFEEPAAYAALGRCYLAGIGTEQDNRKAISLFEKGAALADVSAMYGLGACLLKGFGTKKNYRKGFGWLKKAAENNHRDAIQLVGQCYKTGIGTKKQENLAIEHFKLAADMGDIDSKYELVYYSLFEDVGESDFELAFKMLQDLVDLGHLDSTRLLALCYAIGYNIDENIDKSKKLLDKLPASSKEN